MSDSSAFSVPADSKPGYANAELHSRCDLLVFQLSDRFAAVRLEDVERIAPMAELASPLGLPSALEGVLNLAGVAIPVLRLDRLFDLPAQRLGLYSMLVILKASRAGRVALLVDRATEILSVSKSAFLPIDQDELFNGSCEASVAVADDIVHVLSPTRILLAREQTALAEFRAISQKRLEEWETSQA